MRAVRHWIVILALALALLSSFFWEPTPSQAAPVSSGAAPAPRLQSIAAVTMTSPANCPYGGCAAGQRLSLKFAYRTTGYNANLKPNVKVCIYAPSDWAINPGDSAAAYVAAKGDVTEVEYTQPTTPDCLVPGADNAKPANYDLVIEREAILEAGMSNDALFFALRIAPTASKRGQVLARVFVQDKQDNWTHTDFQEGNTDALTITPLSSPAYVANDPAACGYSSPCYVNSGEDLDGGLGTGLKDAADALNDGGEIQLIGAYTVKSQTVAINKALKITGNDVATLTASIPGPCR